MKFTGGGFRQKQYARRQIQLPAGAFIVTGLHAAYADDTIHRLDLVQAGFGNFPDHIEDGIGVILLRTVVIVSILLPSAASTPLIWVSIFGMLRCSTHTRVSVERGTDTSG